MKLIKVGGAGDVKRTHVVECDCGGDTVRFFSYFEREAPTHPELFGNDPAVEFEEVYTWTAGIALPSWKRFKAIWKILIYGHWENYGVSMSKKSLIGLRDWINKTLIYWEGLEKEDELEKLAKDLEKEEKLVTEEIDENTETYVN